MDGMINEAMRKVIEAKEAVYMVLTDARIAYRETGAEPQRVAQAMVAHTKMMEAELALKKLK